MDKLDELIDELRFKNIIEAVKTVNFSADEINLIAEVIRKKTMLEVAQVLKSESSLYEEVRTK